MAKGGIGIHPKAVETDRRLGGAYLPQKEVPPFEARPIYPHRDDTRIGYIVASFLALRLKVDLQARLEEKGVSELVA